MCTQRLNSSGARNKSNRASSEHQQHGSVECRRRGVMNRSLEGDCLSSPGCSEQETGVIVSLAAFSSSLEVVFGAMVPYVGTASFDFILIVAWRT